MLTASVRVFALVASSKESSRLSGIFKVVFMDGILIQHWILSMGLSQYFGVWLNPKTAIAQGDLPQSTGREGPLSALTGTQRIRLALPQALSARILRYLIPSYRRFRDYS